MDRITEVIVTYPQCDKKGNLTKVETLHFKDVDEAYKKLYKLENLEEELGIDLITLFKALKYGVYYYTSQNQLTHDYVWLYDNYISAGFREKLSYSFMTCFQKQILLFEDYGVTWAIYRPELENEQ